MNRFADRFFIGDRQVGAGQPCFVIAEAGVAHFGSLEKALQLVDLAAASGADAVKFQIFDAAEMIAGEALEWRERMKSRQLPYEEFCRIRDYCRDKGIMFMATAHDRPSLDYLVGLDVPAYKIGSGELGNWPFIRHIAGLGRPVILSTGMYNAEDVATALETIAATGNREVALLHCVTRYPVPPAEVNLCAMITMRERFRVVTGYSDHTAGRHFPLAAVALGAKVLEKHITLDFDVPNAQDWKVSCGPDDLSLLMDELREIELGLGDGRKVPSSGEQVSLNWARKSLVAAVAISAGEILREDMLVAKRPGTGIPPNEKDKVLGRRARQAISKDSLIAWDQIL